MFSQLFDYDKDGILNLRETQKLLRCLGFKVFLTIHLTFDDRTKVYANKVHKIDRKYILAPNFKTRFVNSESFRQMKNKRGQ